MKILNTAEIVEQLRGALEVRDYTGFVNMFADDAVFEVPFGLQSNQKRLKGIEAVRAHFDIIAENPSTKLLELHKVHAILSLADDPDSVTVQFLIQGRSVSTGNLFDMPSSVAIIRCEQGKVKHYKDFPNTIGYAEISGFLSQLAATLTK